MKNRIFKSILVLLLIFVAMPVMGQDWMEIQFKDGTYRKFYLKTVTEMVSTRYDAEGGMHDDYEYQRVVTTDDVFTFLIADIDNISFTKYDEEIAKHNFIESNKAVFQILNDNHTLAEVEEHLDEIKNVESVEDAWGDGHELYVKVKGYGVIPFHFSHGADDEEGESIFNAKDISRMKAMLLPSKTNMSQGGKQLRAVIADQTFYDERFESVRRNCNKPLLEWLYQSGIEPKSIPRPNIDFFYENSSDLENDPHLYDFDIILLETHGGYNEKTGVHSFFTGEVLGEVDFFSVSNPYDSDLTEIENKHSILLKKYEGATKEDINWGWSEEWYDYENGVGNQCVRKFVAYPELTENFFKYRAIGIFKNPHSIFFNGACHSLEGNEWNTAYSHNKKVLSSYSLANTFLDRHLGTYLGYNHSNKRSPHASKYFYGNMMNGYSMDKAAYSLIDKDKVQPVSDSNAQNNYPSYLMRVPDLSNKEAGNVFMVSTHTEESDQAKVNEEYSHNQTVTLEGITYHLDETVEDLHYGFKYKEVDIGHDPLDSWNPVELWKEEPSIGAELVPMTISSDKGNRLFKATLTGLEQGKTYVYRAYTYDGMHYNYGEPCAFTIKDGGDIVAYTSCPDSHHPHLIDLGLPSGTKWACCNVGAQKPEDYGGYYAWGETTEKSFYGWSTYIHCDGSKETCHDIGSDIAGTQYDAATVNWGSPWEIPNLDQRNELVNNCTSEWTTENGVDGQKYTGPNGACIFLPAAGFRRNGDLINTGSNGLYWFSTLHESYTGFAWHLIFFKGNTLYQLDYGLYFGQSVRPVCRN